MTNTDRVIALGFFDGVHTGHGQLMRAVKAAAERTGAVAAAFTFDRSPTAVITGQPVPLLSTVEDRIWLMQHCYGIEEVVVASFDAMQRMDWQDFIVQYLVRELKVVHVVAGCYVLDGKMQRGAQMRLLRDNIVIYDGAIASLQRFKDSVKEVAAGYECGITFEKFQDIKEGDIIEAFLMEQIEV